MPPWNDRSEATKTILPLPRATMSRPSSRESTNWRRQVHLEHAVPQFVRVLGGRRARDRPGVVDEDVDARVRGGLRRQARTPRSRSAKSQRYERKLRPCASTSAATSLPGSSDALTPTTSAPAAASATAAALPIPRRAAGDERCPAGEVEETLTRGSRPGSSSPAARAELVEQRRARARAARPR